MPYFVVVRSQVRPSVIRAGESRRIYTEVLPDAYDTLEAAEQAAQLRAEHEQEWPWTSVFVVVAPNRDRAELLPNPNEYEQSIAEGRLSQAAIRDPEGRVPEPAERLPAFQPPRFPPGLPAPTSLPPAAFAEPLVPAALEALTTAGFTLVPYEHSAYFEVRPRYIATPAARSRATAAAQQDLERLGGREGLKALPDDQLRRLLAEYQNSLFRSPDDVWGMNQSFKLHEGDGAYDIGDIAVFEFRTDAGTDEFLDQVQRMQEERARDAEWQRIHALGSGDLKRSRWFQSEHVLVILRLWAPSDAEFAAAIAPLQGVLGLPMSLDG